MDAKSDRTVRRARELRRELTAEERLLWKTLRNRCLTFKFRRQQPMGFYIVDFVCFEAHLILELDGSRHADEAARAYDLARTEYLQASGFCILRFWNNEIRNNLSGVLEKIQSELE